jgi:hypothetical protein
MHQSKPIQRFAFTPMDILDTLEIKHKTELFMMMCMT